MGWRCGIRCHTWTHQEYDNGRSTEGGYINETRLGGRCIGSCGGTYNSEWEVGIELIMGIANRMLDGEGIPGDWRQCDGAGV